MKKIKFNVILILSILLIPSYAFAEEVTVRVKTNPSSQEVQYSIPAEKDVTTLAEIKEALVNQGVNLDNYIIFNGNYEEPSDTDIICNSEVGFRCDGMTNNKFTNLYLMEKNHTKKEYTLNSIPATDESMARSIFETNWELFEPLSFGSCNNTFNLCTFLDYMNFMAFDNVEIKYNYDEKIAQLAQSIIDEGLIDQTNFNLTDTEFLHYINYGGSLANYASSFKNQLSNLNFRFELDQRGGSADPFETGAIGFYKFMYNDSLYAVKNFMSVTVSHIMYIPTDTTNVEEAIRARLNDLFGENINFEITESDETINEYLSNHGLQVIADGNQHYFIFTINNENDYRYGLEFYIIPKKDSSKINNNVSFKSNDLITNVSVSTYESIPLDTLINVNHLISGDEYSKIIKALNTEEGEVFDIKLYSKAQNKNITKLDNGKFLVSIPIPEKYEGKDLVVYYVDENNNITEHKVTVKDGKATFETDHFSIYTLSIKSGTKVPKTDDNILIYILLFYLSSFGLFIKKKNNQKCR